MKEWQMKLNEWWRNLSSQEQRVVSIGGAIAGLLSFYLIIWDPYLNRLEVMRKQINAEYKTLAWMQAADKEMTRLEKKSPKNSAVVTPVVLLSLLQKEIDEAGLTTTLTQLKQSAQNAVTLHFQKVSFDQMINLLIKTIKEQNIIITHLSVNADTTPGVVDADVVITIGT